MRKSIVKKLNHYLSALDGGETLRIARVLNRQVERLNIKYVSDSGSPRDIRLVLRPWFIQPRELRFFHRLIYAFKAAHQKLCLLYLHNPRIRELMPLRPDEQKWFNRINKDKFQKYQTVFGRWDTNVSFDQRDRITGVKFLETNTVGIGGIHYIPVVSEGIEEILKLGFEREIRPYRLLPQADPRRILAEEIRLHARLIGRGSLNVVFLENRDYLGGTIELPELSRYFLKLGISASLADPRDLYLKKGEIFHRGRVVDIIYRDSELQELIDIERKGHNMEVLKQAFVNNQVISSIAGELDHKSGFEVFTNPDFAGFFSPAERSMFRKYLPWTRLIRERRTTDKAGRRIDLVPYAIKNREQLILKPSRAYGGKGVRIGSLSSGSQWEEGLRGALRSRDGYVLQERVEIRQENFPVFNAKGELRFDDFYSVSGFLVTRNSTAVLGRFSREMVVNVARKGGIIPAFILKGGK